MVALPHRDQTGQIAGILHVIQDVTEMGMVDRQLAQSRNELRLLQDQLTRQNAELAAANVELRRLDELKSAFVSVAAHELRTPLAPIRGYVEVLLDEDVGRLNDDQRAYLETVERSARRLLTLTGNLLDVTRIEAGRVELVLQPTDLSALVKAVAVEYGRQFEGRAQQFTLLLPSDLPPALCDEARAAQIIGNLLSNASKYTPQGGQIVVTVRPAEEDGFIEVSVADNGVGIPVEDQPKLFDRFFRAKSAVLTRASGAGLGLYIVRSLIELHGGRIWFESELGKGSTFYVTFPIADRPA
jgi:signal transduction histidine kinase